MIIAELKKKKLESVGIIEILFCVKQLLKIINTAML